MQTGQFAPAVDIAGGDARFSIAGLSRRSSWVTLAVTQSPPQRGGTRLRRATLDSVKRRRATSTGHGTCRVHAPDTTRCDGHAATHVAAACASASDVVSAAHDAHGARLTHAAGRDGGRMGRCGPMVVFGRGTAETGHVARSSRLRLWWARHAALPNAVREGCRRALGAASGGSEAMAERCAWERRLEPERGRARLSDGARRSGPVGLGAVPRERGGDRAYDTDERCA